MHGSIQCADSLAFLAEPGVSPRFSSRPKNLRVAHLTTVKPSVRGFTNILDDHERFVRDAHLNPAVRTIKKGRDIDTSSSELLLLFGIQHAPADMTLERMRILKEAGLRVISLAYDDSNEYGWGYLYDGRLTAKGSDLIVDATECGMIIDLSHASHQTATDTLNFIRQEQLQTRVMASHSGCATIFPHSRNLQDNVLRGIAELEGYVGIPLITFLLGKHENDSYMELMRHIRHAQTVMGLEKVGIGSDCLHQDRTMDEAAAYFEKMLQMLRPDPKLDARFPDRPQRIIEQGSDLFGVLEEEVGYNKGLFGNNFIEFLKRSLPEK